MTTVAMPGLERRLRRAVNGEIGFDRATRGRYATDASSYQVFPTGVVAPRTKDDLATTLSLAREEGVPVTMRGGGTSQCGQTVNEGLVVDVSRHLDRVLYVDADRRTCIVEPGVVLDDLNRTLAKHGLWFPVDVSTASRATIGGMAGNNSCGGRSLRYGTMRDNVVAIDGLLADGRAAHFGEIDEATSQSTVAPIADALTALGRREADEIVARFPNVQRRVGGYNLDALTPRNSAINLAHVLVGSEGTLAVSTAVELKLWPVIRQRATAICHFGSFRAAMEATQHLVTLAPIAIELVDATMIALGRDIAMFRPLIERCVRGTPEAILLIEFAEETQDQNEARVTRTAELMADLGFDWRNEGARWGGVVAAPDAPTQASLAAFRAAGLNVMMSMKDARKPVSFIEDCAVPLEHLADYTDRLNAIFARHNTRGTFYAHASVGCLHVRPVLNLRQDIDRKAMRAIADEAFEAVRDYKGSHSGEHGDGIVRSEFHQRMFGPQIVSAFGEVKQLFDPTKLLNPHRIVDPPAFDDPALLRYPPNYADATMQPALDWSAWPGGAHGFQGAVEMCNNNGACRNRGVGVMCPSFRATGDETHVTRGRANTLRLALSGQLGPDALTSPDMVEAMSLCVSCKACRRECPTGVDMARMKIEVLSARRNAGHVSLRDRLVSTLPRYAPMAARIAPLLNLRDRSPVLARLSERITGMSARRPLPKWRTDRFATKGQSQGQGAEVVLFADTFNTAFSRETLDAAIKVLVAIGRRVTVASPSAASARPLCCGRTKLAVGDVDGARAEMRRTLDVLLPYAQRGLPIIGLEPSCLFTFRDELSAVLPGEESDMVGKHAVLFEEYLVTEQGAGRIAKHFAMPGQTALLHGHCHQKAFGAMSAVEQALKLVDGLTTKTVESSCCGMAGAFGHQAETYDASMAMAELSLLPAVRSAASETLIVADGFSCRHQIAHGAHRQARHVAEVLADALTS